MSYFTAESRHRNKVFDTFTKKRKKKKKIYFKINSLYARKRVSLKNSNKLE